MRHLILRFIMAFIFAVGLTMPTFPMSVYAAEENLDFEEEKSDIEDAIAENEEDSEATDELENEYNDVQDEQDNVNGRQLAEKHFKQQSMLCKRLIKT